MVRFWTLIDLPRESNEITCKNIPGGKKTRSTMLLRGSQTKEGYMWGGVERRQKGNVSANQ